jgi:hypothetical protein
LILDNTFIKLISINVGDHKTDCATSSTNIVQRLAKSSIMARASDLVPIGVAHRDVVANLQINAPAAIGTLSTAKNMQSSYSVQSRAGLPPLPDVQHLDELIIPDAYRQTLPVGPTLVREPFLMHQESFPSAINGPNINTLLVFCTVGFFTRLCQSSRPFMDGTFSIAPQPSFHQLFTIGSFLLERFVPAMYCIMTGKSEQIYTHLFDWIRNEANTRGILKVNQF